MGAAGTSDARETDRMQEVIGLDFQNCLQTGDKSMTLTGGRIDGHSVPCVLIFNSSGGGYSRNYRLKLLQRTGIKARHRKRVCSDI